MADEHTPKVWDDAAIREAFIDDGGLSEYYDPINGARMQRRIAGGIFDRWLAAHDREVAAKALRDAAVALRSHGVEHEPQANWLHDRAALIELQASEKGASGGEQ